MLWGKTLKIILNLIFQLPPVTLTELGAAEQIWHRLDINGATGSGALGAPELPVLSRLVAVPAGMSLVVRDVASTPQIVPGLRLFPVQDPGDEKLAYDLDA